MANLLDKRGLFVFIYIPSDKTNLIRIPGTNILVKQIRIQPEKLSNLEKIKHFFFKRIFKYSYIHYLYLKNQANQIHDVLEIENRQIEFDLIQYSNLNGLGYFPIKGVCNVLRISSLTHLYLEIGNGYYGIDPLKVQAQIRFENESYLHFKCVLGPSSYMLDRMEVSKDVFKARILSPYENLILSSLSKKPQGSAVKLGFFGSVDYRKGVDLLLDAIVSIKKKDLSLIIVGQLYEDSHENSSIKRRVLNIPNILYYQSQTKAELLSILEDIEIIVLPSRVDNMPNTLLESLGMGKIVIGPNAWGFEEMIEDGVNGFLFDVGSKESLIDKIEFVLSLSFEVRSRISKKAKEFIVGYSSECVFQNCLGVYNQCIKISPN